MNKIVGLTETAQPVVIGALLNQGQFNALKKSLPAPRVPGTDLEAGVIIGIQMTLEALRKDYVL